MAINKVEYGDETLIDLTNDTVSEDTVLEGVSFHSADGEERTGKFVPKEVPDDIVLHKPEGEIGEVPIIDADKLGGELPEHYENDLYLANDSTPSTPSPRDADTLGGQLSSYYAKQSDLSELENELSGKYKIEHFGFNTDGAGLIWIGTLSNDRLPILCIPKSSNVGFWYSAQIYIMNDGSNYGCACKFIDSSGNAVSNTFIEYDILFMKL